jgi:lysophospholipase L1-like esterase
MIPRALVSVIVLGLMLATGCGGGGQSPSSSPASSSPAPQTVTILGESLVLRGDAVSEPRNPVVKVLDVYGFDDKGQKIAYVEGKDWVVSNGGISRSSASRIPDFANYTYAASDSGRFEFVESPRNPPLIIAYDVYVDYLSSAPDEAIQPVGASKPYRRVLCLGDSITAGADTISQYYFNTDADSYCGLLRAFLGSSAQVENFSAVGGVLASVQPDLQQYIDDQPQLVFIAYGMNDHLSGAAGLPAFQSLLNTTVGTLTKSGIDVILIGFLQQNTDWILEDPTQTVAYNQAIQDVAHAYGVPFVDVYDAFNRAEPESELIERLTGDFMHHPNNYGQRIYFSLLLPYFLSRAVMASTVDDYVLGTNP